jgi:hypothetical protein
MSVSRLPAGCLPVSLLLFEFGRFFERERRDAAAANCTGHIFV